MLLYNNGGQSPKRMETSLSKMESQFLFLFERFSIDCRETKQKFYLNSQSNRRNITNENLKQKQANRLKRGKTRF